MERSCLSVQEGYERWAPTYDRDPNPLLALEERQLSLMVHPLEGKRVLDLACGTGRWLAWLMTRGAGSGVGVDFSPAMLGAAKQKTAVRERLVQADCRAIPFANAIFDLVVCSFAVGHIPDLRSVAHEVGRVATPRADIYVSDLHPLAYGQGWQTGFHDSRGAVEIATWPRSSQEFLAPWASAGFDCTQLVECRFGEPERQVFTQSGKTRLFDDFCQVPAVLICHFQRSARR
ncbi:MAG: class I SAM-dependent methyltransferase [Terriglobia bacterium]|jgi:ubiquinone/menaquinone biosynthesis C-methylase UbiE